MKYITTINHLNSFYRLLPLVDGIIFENKIFSCNISGNTSIDKINSLSRILKEKNKESFLSLNITLYDEMIANLKRNLKKIDFDYIDGIFFTDLGILKVLDVLGLKEKAIFAADTYQTNLFDFNFLKDYHIKGSLLSNSLNIDEINYIASNKKYATFYNGFGYHLMFISRRHLITNYYRHENIPDNNKKLYIREELREKERYPVSEDSYGTYIFRGNVTFINKKINNLDYFVLSSLFLPDELLTDALLFFKGQLKYGDILNKYPKYTFDNAFLDKFEDL